MMTPGADNEDNMTTPTFKSIRTTPRDLLPDGVFELVIDFSNDRHHSIMFSEKQTNIDVALELNMLAMALTRDKTLK